MNKKISSIVLATILIFTISSSVFAMTDINNHWAKNDINYLIENKIMSGYNDNTFRPDNKITRAEFLKIVNNVFENNKKADINFNDVSKKDWYYDEIVKAVGAGYTTGYNDNTMRPNTPITREEASKIVVVAAGLDKTKSNRKLDFKDNNEIGNWAVDSIKIMLDKGYISGYPIDNTFRPKRNLSRGEAAKILSQLKKEIEVKEEEKPVEPEKPTIPVVEPVYSVQVSSFSIKEDALELGTALMDQGYNNTFIAKDNYGLYYVIADDFKKEADAIKLKDSLGKKGFESIVSQKDFREYETIKPKKTEVVISNKEKFIKQIDSIENPSSINKLSESLVLDTELARNYYKNLTDSEKKDLPKDKVNKLVAVETKIESLKTPIEYKTKVDVEQAQAWAKSKGAHERFIDIAPVYWEYGEKTGISPEVMYAQAAKETNFGKYTGSVKPEMNNWAGIKTKNPNGDNTYDHEIFETPEDGVRAHYNHMGIYVGVDPVGDPHDRWHVTSTASWAGSVKMVEDLGGKWAPSRDYGISIMRDYVNQMYNF